MISALAGEDTLFPDSKGERLCIKFVAGQSSSFWLGSAAVSGIYPPADLIQTFQTETELHMRNQGKDWRQIF